MDILNLNILQHFSSICVLVMFLPFFKGTKKGKWIHSSHFILELVTKLNIG